MRSDLLNDEDIIGVTNRLLETMANVPGALLPLLHALQNEFGYVPESSIAVIAKGLNLSRAEVHGVISFYHYFRVARPGKHVIQLCASESCQAMGGKALENYVKQRLNIDFHETTPDGRVTLEPVYCLGNCACSPSARIGHQVMGELTPERFDALLLGLDEVPARAVSNDAMLSVENMGQDAIKVYVPKDTTTMALGSDQVAERLQELVQSQGLPLALVRNGSRGLYWLEPMIELDTAEGRVAFGPMTANDVEHFLACQPWEEPSHHPLYLGLTEDLPFLKQQQRLTFARIGRIDPLSLADYAAESGFVGLQKALTMTPSQVVAAVTQSGLRGRGGAAFPTGLKWQTVLDTPSAVKYIVCNADEGDSGTYADRMIMESDPFVLIEGMTIAGLAVGASQGYIYLREEYRYAEQVLNEAIERATLASFLGDDILASGKSFKLEVRLGAGAYICGEETSLLESLEGKRGLVRAKPPLPAVQGLWSQPTVINNVLTLATVPVVLAKGPAYYADYGSGRSRGTLPIQLAGNIKRAGLVEIAFGQTLATVLNEFGGGSKSGAAIRVVQVGGPLGAFLPASSWDTPLDYEAFSEINAMLGHGGVVAFDDTVDLSDQARFAMAFCALESCGKCTPCRIGAIRGVEVIDAIKSGQLTEAEQQQSLDLLEDLCDTMVSGSLCAMGGMTPFPVLSAIEHFPEDFKTSSVIATDANRKP